MTEEQPVRYPAIPACTTDPASMKVAIERLTEGVQMMQGTRKPGVAGLPQTLLDVKAQAGQNAARIQDVIQVQADTEAAFAQRTQSLEAEFTSAIAKTNARVLQVDEAYADKTQALAQRAVTLEAGYRSLDGNLAQTNARVTQVDTARASGDEALARQATTLTADFTSFKGTTSAQFQQINQAISNGDSALANRIETLRAEVGTHVGNLLAIAQNEATARANQDGALAQQINTVSATANQGTANGQIAFRAGAGIPGVSASWQMTLTAQATGGPELFAGFYVMADATSGSGSSIGFRTDTFKLFTGFDMRTVFVWTGNQFTFNGNVTVNGNLIVTGSINSGQLAGGSVSQLLVAGSGGNVCSVSFNSPTGGQLVMLAQFNGAPGAYFPNPGSIGDVTMYLDGTPVSSTVPSFDSNANGFCYLTSFVSSLRYIGPGNHSVTLAVGTPFGLGGVALIVMELRR